MEQMIINADDFGLKPSVNRAIIEAFEKGWINSTTIMANMPGFAEAVELAHQHNIVDNIGVHLVLTEGEPLTAAIKGVPFLFKRERPLRKLFMLNAHEKQLVFQEFSAQIESVRKKGIPITHLDTHHQIHDVWAISQIIIKLLQKFDIPSMRMLNNLEHSNLYKNMYRSAVNRYLSIKKVGHTNFFGSREDYLKRLKQQPTFRVQKKVEIMVHPDYNTEGALIDKLHGKTYELDFLKEDINQLIKY